MFVNQEIHQVLEHVVERNQVTDNNHTQCELFNAWRQVVEVMMTSSGSHDFLQSDSRMALLFELLHDLLLKVRAIQVLVYCFTKFLRGIIFCCF